MEWTSVLRLVLLATLAVFSNAGWAQWYQGPSGGAGGGKFDHWQQSAHAHDIAEIGVLERGGIHCLYVDYRATATQVARRVSSGFCNPGTDDSLHYTRQRIRLAPDEYLLGIAGRFGDHVNSLRFYTSKGQTLRVGLEIGNGSFGYTAPSGQMIAGFVGRAGMYVDAIGVIYVRCSAQKQPCR